MLFTFMPYIFYYMLSESITFCISETISYLKFWLEITIDLIWLIMIYLLLAMKKLSIHRCFD